MSDNNRATYVTWEKVAMLSIGLMAGLLTTLAAVWTTASKVPSRDEFRSINDRINKIEGVTIRAVTALEALTEQVRSLNSELIRLRENSKP